MVTAGTTLLRAEGLAYTYPGPVRALDGVDLELAAGELLVICGPNGSGKSTLLRLLSGLLTPERGAVQLGGEALAGLPPRRRARAVTRVPQSLRSLPDVSVEDFALSGRYAHIDRWRGPSEADRRAVAEALAATDAADLGGRPLAAVSGGQRQRVLVARAVASEAPVLLVDEPTTGLDPEHQVRVLELLAGLTCEGRGVVLVTHDLNLAAQFATSMLLLADGRVVTRGTPAEVLRPEVLVPVYGERLHFGEADGRRFVLPWRDLRGGTDP